MLAFAPQVDMTRELVTLRADVPVAFELSQAACTRFDFVAAAEIFKELGFRRLLEQLEAERQRRHGGTEARSPGCGGLSTRQYG